MIGEAKWFCGITGNVGIIRVRRRDGVKYYIGGCAGLNVERDIERIADWGVEFPKEAGDALFNVKE